MKKFGTVLLCLIVGGIFSIGSIKLLDGVPEFCLAVLPAVIFYLIMMTRYKPEKTKGEIFIEEAKAAGRVVTARLVKTKYILGSNEKGDLKNIRDDHHIGKYEYVVNGRKYHCKRVTYNGRNSLSNEITLYYAKNKPKEAIRKADDIDESDKKANILLAYILIFVVYGILKLVFDVDWPTFINEQMLQ